MANINPRMPAGHYATLPDSTLVVVRQYERRLPAVNGRRRRPSEERYYKRVQKDFALPVELEHEKHGNEAFKFELGHGGGKPHYVKKPKVPSPPRRNPSPAQYRSNIRAVIGGSIALLAFTVATRWFGRG